MHIIMSCFFVFLCGILGLRVTAINVTNSGNQQEIIDMKKDIVMLRNLVTGMNTTILTQQQEMRSMNSTIYAQQQEMRSMNSTIYAQLQEMRSMNSTIYAQQQEMRSMNSTIYTQQQEMRSMNTTIYTQQQEMRSMNTTIYTQQQEMRSMNVTVHAQLQEIGYLIGTTKAQEQKIALMESETQQVVRTMNSTIQAQQQMEELMNETIQDQQHKIANIESTIQILKQDNRTLNEEVVFLRKNNSAEIEHLKDEDTKRNQNYEAFQIVVHDLVTTVNTLRNTSQLLIGRINDNLTSLARQIHHASLSFLDAQKILKDLENSRYEAKINMSLIFKKLESQRQEMRNLQSGRNRSYAFSVSTSSDLYSFQNQKIVYDKVITNTGGAYNSNTGIFTCPSPGTYVFTWSTMSISSSRACYAYIHHNGNQLLESYSVEANGGYYEVASNTIVLTLTVGDHVWIQTATGTHCYGYPYTAFSGWKI